MSLSPSGNPCLRIICLVRNCLHIPYHPECVSGERDRNSLADSVNDNSFMGKLWVKARKVVAGFIGVVKELHNLFSEHVDSDSSILL